MWGRNWLSFESVSNYNPTQTANSKEEDILSLIFVLRKFDHKAPRMEYIFPSPSFQENNQKAYFGILLV